MRILLISTYELGHQPLHIASPAAALDAAGHLVRAMDLSVGSFDTEAVEWAELVAISVPMHTAMRLAGDVVERVRRVKSEIPIALYGLYAGMGSVSVDASFVGEYESDLVAWADVGGTASGIRVRLGQSHFGRPRRDLLPPQSSYAHLRVDHEHHVVGYVETSHGCRHRCRHCPIPAVYDGRYRIVDRDVVVDDALAQIDTGARHLTFGDPDFLNGPAHSMAVLERVHAAAPEVGFDVTVKVEHLLRHRSLLPRLRDANVRFVVSAFESTDDRTLALLDKGHTVDDMRAAIDACREVGLDIHPSWMPFVPWTTTSDLVDIFGFLDVHDLLGVTDPVQMSIRLLVPPGSLLLEIPEVAAAMGPLDEHALTHRWQSLNPGVDELQKRLASIAAAGADGGRDPIETLVEQWSVVLEADGSDPATAQIPAGATSGRPRMTEPWFC